ncbi:unnamed protein product [Adineta steineri]|uniref:WWE domain-containing protein n=1 Tax=Adineta steineri TaxID=433720 RepID=A0A813XLM5_9BILA|nr:unnamed protein product [Adineta steineri]CAF0872067.1 unnamed protein product [Adineta steineri]
MNQEENKVVWSWKSNKNPWSLKQADEWCAFPSLINNQIEQAYLADQDQIIIDENYKINFKHFLQVNIPDASKQRPIRRCLNTHMISYYCRERFNFVQPLQHSIMDDTPYYGSVFITDWLIMFTEGTLKIEFSQLINELISGISTEGENLDLIQEAQHLNGEIRAIKKKNMENLQQCCARLYTKPCFLFKIVNETLRDNNRKKLKTLGPFCYLLYNYIGIRHNKYLSIRQQIKRLFKPAEEQFSSLTVYRGEELLSEQIETYKQAVGKGFSYKWSSFISTSKSREVAEMYGSNVLYIIQIPRISSNDQYVDLSSIAYIKDEQEILLRPGVRLRIDKYHFHSRTQRYVFYVQILPSFISNIM